MNSDTVLLHYGSYSQIGLRSKMEDRSSIFPDFLPIKAGFFAIFDGHGGEQVAEICASRLPQALKEELLTHVDWEHVDWEPSLQSTFIKVDSEIQSSVPPDVGSTAVAAIITSSLIVIANCGDSRAVLCRGTEPVPLSEDHKPSRPDELRRIVAAGGHVIEWGGCSRLYGVLGVSRSIGDASMKPYITAEPEIRVSIRQDEDEFLILASDGLWDVLGNNEVVEMARKFFRHWYRKRDKPDAESGHGHDSAAQAAAKYIAKQASLYGSKDNLSIIVIDMKGAASRRG